MATTRGVAGRLGAWQVGSQVGCGWLAVQLGTSLPRLGVWPSVQPGASTHTHSYLRPLPHSCGPFLAHAQEYYEFIEQDGSSNPFTK